MDDEDQLPTVPHEPSSSPSSFGLHHIRKRRFGHASSEGTPSDPPYFSSDDGQEHGLEDYSGPRKKRVFQGQWWQQSRDGKRFTVAKTKGGFARNVDSGVWMGSEGSMSSTATEGSDITGMDEDDLPATSPIRTTMPPPLSLSERAAQNVIDACVEAGSESIDLSDMGLTTLSAQTLQPLHLLVPSRVSLHTVPDEGAFRPLVASLKLFLSNNSFKTFPHAICDLTNLTVLSLRKNELTEIPPAVGELKNLEELNLAINHLRWLPWELLKLLGKDKKLEVVSFQPNPFVKGFRHTGRLSASGEWKFEAKSRTQIEVMLDRLREKLAVATDLDRRAQLYCLLKLYGVMHDRATATEALPNSGHRTVPKHHAWREDPIYVGSSRVAFFEVDGTLCRSSGPSPSSLPESEDVVPISLPSISPSEAPAQSRVRSLFEHSLQKVAENWAVTWDNTSYENISPTVERAFEKAEETGLQTCSMCGRAYIIPRTEWMEYWHYLPDSNACSSEALLLPFLRRGCSWGCVADGV